MHKGRLDLVMIMHWTTSVDGVLIRGMEHVSTSFDS